MKKNVKKYNQVIHKNCCGEIVLISDKYDIQFCCKKCEALWEINMPFQIGMSKEFTLVKGE